MNAGALSAFPFARRKLLIAIAGDVATEGMLDCSDVRLVMAHHEASHAVIAYALGQPPYEVSIVPDAHTSGRVRYGPATDDEEPPIGDQKTAANFMVLCGVKDDELKPTLELAEREVREMLADHDLALRMIAGALLERGSIIGDDLSRLMRAAFCFQAVSAARTKSDVSDSGIPLVT